MLNQNVNINQFIQQESRTAKWRTCHELWPLMTFDLCKMHKHYATNKTNVSPVIYLFHSYIHHSGRKIAFFGKKPNFCTNYGPWWPLTFVKSYNYIHFWKAHITYYHCAKFQVSVFNSVREKCNNKVLGPFFELIMSPYDLWPLREVIKLSIFGKPSLHTTSVATFKFMCSIVSEKSATLKFLGLFWIMSPYDLWPLRDVIKLCIFEKPSSHTTIIPSFKILWLIVSEKSSMLKLDLHADADAGRIPTQCINT